MGNISPVGHHLMSTSCLKSLLGCNTAVQRDTGTSEEYIASIFMIDYVPVIAPQVMYQHTVTDLVPNWGFTSDLTFDCKNLNCKENESIPQDIVFGFLENQMMDKAQKASNTVFNKPSSEPSTVT